MAGNRIFKIVFTGDAKGVGDATDQIEGHFSKMGTAVAGAFFGIGQKIGQELLSIGTDAFAFATNLADKFQEAGSETRELMRITGDTSEHMSTLRFAASDTGVGFEVLTHSLTTFARNLEKGKVGIQQVTQSAEDMNKEFEDTVDAQLDLATAEGRLTELRTDALRKGETWTERQLLITKATWAVHKAQGEVNLLTGDSVKVMEKAGITVKDAAGNYLPMWDLLKNTSAQFKSMPDGVQKTAMAMEIFGKRGAEMLPLLNKGADGFEDLALKAKEYGWVLSEEDDKTAKAGAKSKRELSEAWEGLQIQLGGPVSTALTTITNAVKGPLLDSTKKLQEWMDSKEFKEGMTKAMDWLQTNVPKIAQSVSDFVTGLGKWWGDHGESIVNGFQNFANFVKDLGEHFGNLSKALDPVFGTLQKIGDIPGISTILGFVSGSKLREGFGDITGVIGGTKKVDGFFAQGGIVPATPGGRNVVVGEGGEDEWIIPQSKMGALVGGGGGGIVVNVHTLNANSETGRIIAESLRDYRNAGGTVKVA